MVIIICIFYLFISRSSIFKPKYCSRQQYAYAKEYIYAKRIDEAIIEYQKFIDEYIDNLLIGLSNIINIIQPEAICIGGSFVYYEKILYTRLIEKT